MWKSPPFQCGGLAAVLVGDGCDVLCLCVTDREKLNEESCGTMSKYELHTVSNIFDQGVVYDQTLHLQSPPNPDLMCLYLQNTRKPATRLRRPHQTRCGSRKRSEKVCPENVCIRSGTSTRCLPLLQIFLGSYYRMPCFSP